MSRLQRSQRGGSSEFLVIVGFIVIIMGFFWGWAGNALGFGSADATHSDALVVFGLVVIMLGVLWAAMKGESEV